LRENLGDVILMDEIGFMESEAPDSAGVYFKNWTAIPPSSA
jgi:hypothetical protein